MICEKCERIGRLNKIPHEVFGGGDDIAEMVECPWDWEKEDIEEYITKLCFKEVEEFQLENPALFEPYESLTPEQALELGRFLAKTSQKYKAMTNML